MLRAKLYLIQCFYYAHLNAKLKVHMKKRRICGSCYQVITRDGKKKNILSIFMEIHLTNIRWNNKISNEINFFR